MRYLEDAGWVPELFPSDGKLFMQSQVVNSLDKLLTDQLLSLLLKKTCRPSSSDLNKEPHSGRKEATIHF